MQKIFLVLSQFIIALNIHAQKKLPEYHMPAEWEPQSAVWMGWYGKPIRDSISAQMITAIYKDEQIKMLYRDDTARFSGNRFLSKFNIDTSKIKWVKDSVTFYWMRDSGPIFLTNGSGDVRIADFGWNMFGESFVTKKPMTERALLIGRIDRRMAEKLSLETVPTDIVTEGGAMEVNGKGVLMAIEETAKQRNPGKTLEEIEKEYLRVLGCTKIVWLKRATIQDRYFDGATAGNYFTVQGANGHIDEMAKFVNANTIILAKIDESERNKNPISKIDYDILEENYEVLKKATGANGKPFNVIRVPSPDLTQSDFISKIVIDDDARKNPDYNFSSLQNGDTAVIVSAVSYMNIFIANKAILIPAYWHEGMSLTEKRKDEEVKNLFMKLYPDRKIVQINPLPINYHGGGGFHCATQQEPMIK
ncbi:MAG: agmatine deiminase family protein [Bacteroidota bacterium]|nr:agmatine deiminase family protein [Bacteroidota bacterium]